MDSLGLVLSAALCTAVFVVFDLLIRLLGDAVGEVRYTVAPTLLGGLNAWREESAKPTPANASEPPDSPASPRPARADPRPESGHRDTGLVVPVAPVIRHRTHCAA